MQIFALEQIELVDIEACGDRGRQCGVCPASDGYLHGEANRSSPLLEVGSELSLLMVCQD